MTSQPTFRDALHDALDAEGSSLTHADPSQTVRPDQPGGPMVVVQSGLGPFGETLGQGGMGVVRIAEQRTLQRTVAVKSLRMGSPGPEAVQHLLQEAFVAGLLDHPNVLPVHDILVDEAGHPHILMKRVEGEPWTAWARSPARLAQALDVKDPLAWNLGVLLQVCNAIAYAHDRGILHRDLKLDNVMIGPFGEVLVLDWGIAVALDGRHGDRVPLARDQTRVAGTPRMMAPEMATGDGPSMGPHTDVYLLGGVLYHVLSGHTPHRGADVTEVLSGIGQSEPELPERVPSALARIVRKAMAFDPADRFADVPSLSREIRHFLEHRGSVRLAARARQSVQQLLDELGSGQDRSVVYRAFDQARFGFEQALSEWPDNPVARDGIRQARLELARWELTRGEPGTAEALLEPVQDVPQDLIQELSSARASQRAREQELQQLRTDVDPRVGQRTRAFVIGILGVLWLIMPPIYGVYRAQLQWWHLFATSAALTAVVLGLGWWARDSLSRTALNRASFASAAMIPISQFVLDGSGALLGLEAQQIVVLRPALWFVIVAMYAVTTLPAVWPAALAFGLCALAAGFWPASEPWLVTVASALLLGLLVRLWWTPELLVDPRKTPVAPDDSP